MLPSLPAERMRRLPLDWRREQGRAGVQVGFKWQKDATRRTKFHLLFNASHVLEQFIHLTAMYLNAGHINQADLRVGTRSSGRTPGPHSHSHRFTHTWHKMVQGGCMTDALCIDIIQDHCLRACYNSRAARAMTQGMYRVLRISSGSSLQRRGRWSNNVHTMAVMITSEHHSKPSHFVHILSPEVDSTVARTLCVLVRDVSCCSSMAS